jgi:hypothetical protein
MRKIEAMAMLNRASVAKRLLGDAEQLLNLAIDEKDQEYARMVAALAVECIAMADMTLPTEAEQAKSLDVAENDTQRNQIQHLAESACSVLAWTAVTRRMICANWDLTAAAIEQCEVGVMYRLMKQGRCVECLFGGTVEEYARLAERTFLADKESYSDSSGD